MIDRSLPTSVVFVRQYKARKVIYDVEMASPSDSQAVRDAYGLFWRKKSGRRLPDGLRGISFTNATTFSTRVRVRVLKEICHKHQAANPSTSCFVTSYLPRPELKIRERRGPVTSLTYTKAVQKMSHHLSIPFLKELYQYARSNLPEGEVTERFLVLGPDLLLLFDGDQLPMQVDDTSASSVAPPALAPGASSNVNEVVPPVLSSSQLTSTAPPTSTPAPVRVSSSPTYAMLNPAQFTPPPILSSSLLVPAPAPLPEVDGDFTVVNKRNRNRFARKSTPYPQPR
jgi:hypothetical protein